MYEGDTPFGTQYSVFLDGTHNAKGRYGSTQKFCYIVRSHQFLILKGPIFIKKHNTSDI